MREDESTTRSTWMTSWITGAAVLFAAAVACVPTRVEDAGETPPPLPASPSNAVDDAGSLSSPSDASEPSCTATPDAFETWRAREPIYELYVRHFSSRGNFKGVEERLPELKALGVGIVWLLPVNEIGSIVPANGGVAIDAPHGNPYAVKSYERLNTEYGSDGTQESARDDLRQLVARAHCLGMRVILDWVPNHTAWDNALLNEHPDWYVRANGAAQGVKDFPWIAQLDWSKSDLQAYMIDVMQTWVRTFDLDGFRIDFAHHMPISFFRRLRTELERIKPVFLLAEAGNTEFHPTFDMTYDWDVYPVFGDVANGWKTAAIIDEKLLHTQLIPYAGMPDALVMRMTYNHDDNGKFTLTERYKGGIKTFAVLAATLPGKPLVFDGQEVGMNVFDGKTVRPSINLGHDPIVKIDWADPDGYRTFYTKLLQLFRHNSALHHAGGADFRKIDTQPGDYPYSFIRRDGANSVVVVLNLSGTDYPNVVLAPQDNVGPIDGEYTDLFSSERVRISAGQSIRLEPWAYRVYVQGPAGSL